MLAYIPHMDPMGIGTTWKQIRNLGDGHAVLKLTEWISFVKQAAASEEVTIAIFEWHHHANHNQHCHGSCFFSPFDFLLKHAAQHHLRGWSSCCPRVDNDPNRCGMLLKHPFFSPHHCLGFLFFAWIPPLSSVRRPPPPRPSLTHSLAHSHSLTHTHSHSLIHSLYR